MRILQINTAYSGGGAADIACRLHHFLLEKTDHESVFLYGRGQNDGRSALRIGSRLNFCFSVALERFFGRPMSWHFSPHLKEEIGKADLVHLHNLHGYYVDPGRLIDLLVEADKPVVWTFHDQWPITGRCAFPEEPCPDECPKWQSGCGQCAYKHIYPKTYMDRSSVLWRQKKKSFNRLSKAKTVLVCPSRWLSERVKRSYLCDYPIEVIPHGLEIKGEKSLPKETLRASLGLPNDKQLVLFAAADLNNVRKGVRYVLEIFESFPETVRFVSVGKERKGLGGDRLIQLGYLVDKAQLMSVYQASDVYVNPTLGEVFSLTTAEAMANGLPVVGFNTQPLPEVLGDRCGILVEKGNTQALRGAIQQLLDNKELAEEFSRNAVERYQRNFTLQRFGQAHAALYEKLLGKLQPGHP